ncbi:MAG: type II toxin-antitoxin system VapC family toxin [Ilumatobacteraceae bacterium]
MALVYFDSSALVKLLLDEAGSDIAAALWNGCDAALSSRLAYPEVCAALAAAVRNRTLTDSDAAAATSEWEVFWASIRPVEMSVDVGRTAGALAARQQLGGADAVHLASALALGSTDLTVAAWDKRLHAGAAAVGLAVAPATLG